MKKLILAACAVVLSLGLGMSDAEAAKRLGGGKSAGMQRESVSQKQASPQPAAPTQQNAAAPAQAPAAAPAAPAAQPKRNWLGPLAGLAAGIGLAALLSHFGLGEGVANFLMIALLVMAAIFVLKLIFGKKRPAEAGNGDALQYAGVGGPAMAPPPVAQMPGSAEPAVASTPAAAPVARNIPADFDTDAFLRVAKLNFIRLQAANDTRNLDDLREFLTPEFFAEVRLQMDERGVGKQETDVVQLDGEVLEVVTENNRHVVSVRFNGSIREDNGTPESFDEVWHLVKPADGSRGWQVAGIQQLA